MAIVEHASRSRPPRRLLLALCAATAAAAAGGWPCAAAAAAEGAKPPRPNPDYAAWAALEKGSWVKVRVDGSLRKADWTMRLAEVGDEAAVLDVTETRPEGTPRDPWKQRVPAHAAAADEPAEAGEATLKVGGQPIKCRWETRRRTGPDGESGDTTWTSDDVPGFMKRVSWLAPDRQAGLPAAQTTETVVGFLLTPHPGDAKPVRKAGEGTGPKKLQWTYKFDPPGWRKWEQTSPTTWVERWETGQEVQFRIDRYIADGERTGVVVRRLPGEDLESVIPDAGKDADFWSRSLPDGKWASLGKVESAE